MNEQQSTKPADKPYLVIEDKTQKCMAIAEHVAKNLKGLETDMYAGDNSVLTYGVLHAQNATNQLLVTLFTTINDGFKGFDPLMGDIMKAMNGDTGGF